MRGILAYIGIYIFFWIVMIAGDAGLIPGGVIAGCFTLIAYVLYLASEIK